jgi:parvulin-like peptidyl-prolyl isomerase
MSLSRSNRGSIAASLSTAIFALLLGAGGGFWVGRAMAAHATRIVATVNGAEMTSEQFIHRLETAATSGPAGPMGTVVLHKLINEALILQFAAKQGVSPTQEQIDARYAQVSAQPDFTERLTRSHETEADAKHEIEVNLAQQDVWARGVDVTDAEVHSYYDALTSKTNPRAPYYHPETVTVAIIVNDDPKQIDKAINDLHQGGSFAAVARAYSKDKSRSNGGEMPPVRRGNMNKQKFPGLEDKLFSMKPGQRIERLHLAGAEWIIECRAHEPEILVPFDKVKDDCRSGALVAKGMKTYGKERAQAFQDFQKAAVVSVLWPQYKKDFH